MTAGVIIYRTGNERLEDLGGLARKMPVTAVTFSVAALSIAGFPLFNGFVSKGIVISASHYTFPEGPLAFAGFTTLELLLLVGGVGTFLSFIKFGYYAFLHGEYGGRVKDANRGRSVAMVSVAALCVFFGVVDSALFGLLPFDVESKDVVQKAYTTYTVDHVVEGMALAAIGVVGFVVLKTPLKKVGHVPDVDTVYNWEVFQGTRLTVTGITELYAEVDRLVVRGARASVDAVTRPRATLGPIVGRERVQSAGMGTSVVLVITVLVGALALLLL
jgi:multicomponent Na+:H+ antiporter subunit D